MRNVLLVVAVCVSGLFTRCAANVPSAPAAENERGELLELIARGYYPGRSGQILFVPERGEVFVRKPMGFYRFMHGSPWEYDRHIPLIFYGPDFIEPGNQTESAHQQDVVPTLLSMLGLPPAPTMSGRVLDSIVREHEGPPRVAVIMVLDGMRADYLERYRDVMPTLTRLGREGASFSDAWVNYVPSVTSAGHTTIATGADPRIHGIAGNGYYDPARDGEFALFNGHSPENMMVLGVADLWSLHTDGAAVIIAQGTAPGASVSLAGHGACKSNGRPIIAAIFSYRKERWVTNTDCFVLPDYLEGVSAREFWESTGSDIDSGRVFVMTPLLPRYQMDALIAMIERENVGKDDTPDLLLINFKTPDYVGHNFGPDSNEMREALEALDREINRALAALEAAAGPNGYVLAITSDHGMPSEPEGTGHERHFTQEIMATIHDELDPDEERLLYEFLDTASHQLFVNDQRMHELGLELSDIAAVVENLPYIRAAFTEDEASAAARALN